MTTPRVEWSDDVRVLSRALDQAGDVLDHVHADQLSLPTPCRDWDVTALADHLVAAPATALAMMRGEQVDWSAPPAHVSEEWGPAFRVVADDLIHAWHEGLGGEGASADWQSAELAVHTWDLATAVGFPLGRLDPEVAVRGLAFMQANLTEENRGPAFGPEQPAGEGAGPYERIAAYAGRPVA
jgi:uncharacterized protein (TIGR03086 family)